MKRKDVILLTSSQRMWYNKILWIEQILCKEEAYVSGQTETHSEFLHCGAY